MPLRQNTRRMSRSSERMISGSRGGRPNREAIWNGVHCAFALGPRQAAGAPRPLEIAVSRRHRFPRLPRKIIAAGEDLHQLRHQAFDGIDHVGRDRRAPPYPRRHVLRHVAHVVVERGRPLVGEFACHHGRERVLAPRREQRLDNAGGHSGQSGFRNRSARPPIVAPGAISILYFYTNFSVR